MSGPRPIRLERGVLTAVALIVVALDLAAVAAYALAEATADTAAGAITRDIFLGFEFTNEHNIPAWVSSALWLVFGLTAAVLAAASPGRRFGFAVMGAVGLLASLDEYTMIHERLAAVGEQLLPESVSSSIGAWVVPGLIISLGVGALLLRFVLRLPGRSRFWLVAAAGVFLIGALGAEALWWAFTGGSADRVTGAMLVLSALEENLELLGVGLAVAALASLIGVARDGDGYRLSVATRAAAGRRIVGAGDPV